MISQHHTSDIGVNIGGDIGGPDITASYIRYRSSLYHRNFDISIPDITNSPILLSASGPGLGLHTPTLKGSSPPRPGFLNSLLPHGHSVCHSHIPWKCSAVAPHPYVDLEEPATGPTVGSSISSRLSWDSASVPVWDGIAGVPIQVARNQWHTPKYVLDRADVEGRQHCTRPLVQHGDDLLLHTAVWCQADWFNGVEEYQ